MPEELTYDGRPVPVRPGQSVAAALWASGIRSWRTTRFGAAPRGLFCGIGACYDCLATVDGEPGQRLCLADARPGQVVTPDSWILDDLRGPSPGPQPRPTGTGTYDVAVVGAGPAGLAAAATAALGGARVVLVDAAARPGGQYWRHRDGETGHGYRDWHVYTGLTSIVEERVDHLSAATVWFVEPGFVLHTTAGRVSAGRIVLATGAYDRVHPFPGWDLPGVVTAGAAQALLKGSDVLIGGSVVVAGAGPFLLPVAVGLARAGARVVSVIEAGDPRRYLSRPGALAGAVARLGEAAEYAAALARYRIPYRVRHAVLEAHGSPEVRAVTVGRLDDDGRPVPESRQRLECDALAVGHGFTANLDLPLALGCATRIGADGGLAVMVGGDGQTSVAGVYAAGEVTGVGGAALASVGGQLAGAAAATAAGAGAPLSARGLAALRRRRRRLLAFADTMHRAHAAPARWLEWLTADTLVCRCEEVPVSAVRAAVTELGATDARSVKQVARPGMGWCQGRVCGSATAALTAAQCERSVRSADLLTFAARPLAAPVRLDDLAAPD